MKTELYHIDGMACAACSAAVERVTRKIPGVSESNVNLTTNKMVITYEEAPQSHQNRWFCGTSSLLSTLKAYFRSVRIFSF